MLVILVSACAVMSVHMLDQALLSKIEPHPLPPLSFFCLLQRQAVACETWACNAALTQAACRHQQHRNKKIPLKVMDTTRAYILLFVFARASSLHLCFVVVLCTFADHVVLSS